LLQFMTSFHGHDCRSLDPPTSLFFPFPGGLLNYWISVPFEVLGVSCTKCRSQPPCLVTLPLTLYPDSGRFGFSDAVLFSKFFQARPNRYRREDVSCVTLSPDSLCLQLLTPHAPDPLFPLFLQLNNSPLSCLLPLCPCFVTPLFSVCPLLSFSSHVSSCATPRNCAHWSCFF